MSSSCKHSVSAEAVTFEPEVWRAVVNGQLQRPEFNSRGAAAIFAEQVARGIRKPEPVQS